MLSVKEKGHVNANIILKKTVFDERELISPYPDLIPGVVGRN
jgi:hypothetical protein